MSSAIPVTIKNNDSGPHTFQGEILEAGAQHTFPADTKFDDVFLYRSVIADTPIVLVSVDGGTSFISDELECVQTLFGTTLQFRFEARHIDPANRIKFAMLPDPHATDHQDGGTDLLNVGNLSGVLADPQHPITSEVISALGALGDSNPNNHNRFAQSEISALPEAQLNLDFVTHDNLNDPTSNQKAGLDAANAPGAGNGQLLTGVEGDARYATTGHGHTNLPTNDQKDALDNAASPSSSNPLATQNDLVGLSSDFIEVNATALLARTGDAVGDAIKVLEDETISSVLYEAGWYTYRGSGAGGGFDGTDWDFHSTREEHTHDWADVNKAGSILSDLGDVPAKPNDGSVYVLQELSGVLTWVLASTLGGGGGGGGDFTLYLMRADNDNDDWFWFDSVGGDDDDGDPISTHETSFVPPFNCKIKRITYMSRSNGSSGRVVEVKAYERAATDSSNIATTNTLSWTILSSGAGIIHDYQEARFWAYDAESENLNMVTTKKYAFRFKRTAGSGTIDNPYMIMELVAT